MALERFNSAITNKILQKRISDTFDKTNQLIGPAASVYTTDYLNLLTKLASTKIAQNGMPIVDHVTITADIFNTQTTSGAYSKQSIPTLQNKVNNLKAKKDYLINVGELQLKKLNDAFKMGENNQNSKLFSILLDHVIITTNRSKEIVRTVVIGDDSSINEIISNGNLEINLSGILAGNNSYQTDTKAIEQLNALYNLKSDLSIQSIYLNNQFDTFKILIENISFKQRTDYGNLTDYTINCIGVPATFNAVIEEPLQK